MPRPQTLLIDRVSIASLIVAEGSVDDAAILLGDAPLHPVAFEISDLAFVQRMLAKPTEWPYDVYPNLTPPNPQQDLWFEWFSTEHEATIGCYLRGISLSEGLTEESRAVIAFDALYGGHLFMEYPKSDKVHHLGSFRLPVTREGRYALADELIQLTHSWNEEWTDTDALSLRAMLAPVLFALTLLHTRSVDCVPHIPEGSFAVAWAKKRKRHLATYYTFGAEDFLEEVIDLHEVLAPTLALPEFLALHPEYTADPTPTGLTTTTYQRGDLRVGLTTTPAEEEPTLIDTSQRNPLEGIRLVRTGPGKVVNLR